MIEAHKVPIWTTGPLFKNIYQLTIVAMVTVYYHSHHHNVPFRFMNVCAHACRCVCVCWRKVVISVCIPLLKPDNNPACSFLGTIFLCCLRSSPTSLEAPKLARMARQQVLGICLFLLLSAGIIRANNCVRLFPTWFRGVRLESLWLTQATMRITQKFSSLRLHFQNHGSSPVLVQTLWYVWSEMQQQWWA